MSEIGPRYRGRNYGENGKAADEDEKKDEEFLIRESPLTVLIGSSWHLRTIYHIFVVILLIVFCDTLIFDFVDRGKINIGLNVLAKGFGDVARAFKLWLYIQGVAVAFYPLLTTYAWLGKCSIKYKALRSKMVIIGVAGVTVAELALAAVPIYELSRKYLALASSATITCEMFRLMMKVVAVAVTCGPRCLTGSPSLPTFKHYLYFLFAPTLLYRDQYPRTKKVHWDRFLFHLMEVGAIILYYSFVWKRFIMPYWSDYGKQDKVEASQVVRAIFASMFPGVISFLCLFYCVLHAWPNAWAELLRFGDRRFYKDWWTSSQFSRYYRCWNLIVYSWLHEYIYSPLTSSVGRPLATFIVFLVSAIAHEIILWLSFGFFYPVLFVQFGILGVSVVPVTEKYGRRYPNTLNLLIWLGFFIGNGLLWSLYPMEYFARQNCPPSESDSFFVPKSWSCPEVILKPDWSFQNPLRIFY